MDGILVSMGNKEGIDKKKRTTPSLMISRVCRKKRKTTKWCWEDDGLKTITKRLGAVKINKKRLCVMMMQWQKMCKE